VVETNPSKDAINYLSSIFNKDSSTMTMRATFYIFLEINNSRSNNNNNNNHDKKKNGIIEIGFGEGASIHTREISSKELQRSDGI
jgi:hypothetical protein